MIYTNNNERFVNNKTSMLLTCKCGGKFIPLTHVIFGDRNTFYRCNKCGKDIRVQNNSK